MRIEILHSSEEQDHAEHIRHLVALQIGPEDIDVVLCEESPEGCVCSISAEGHVVWRTDCVVHGEMAAHFARRAGA